MSKIIPTSAKSYEKIGKRISISHLDSKQLGNPQEHLKIILDDAYQNIEETLNKDGHTGKLTTPDGILRGKPQLYKGFFIQVFGMKRYESDLDVFGKLYWFGWAKREEIIKGKKFKVEFGTEHAQRLGFETEREAGQWLFAMVDNYRMQRNN